MVMFFKRCILLLLLLYCPCHSHFVMYVAFDLKSSIILLHLAKFKDLLQSLNLVTREVRANLPFVISTVCLYEELFVRAKQAPVLSLLDLSWMEIPHILERRIRHASYKLQAVIDLLPSVMVKTKLFAYKHVVILFKPTS